MRHQCNVIIMSDVAAIEFLYYKTSMVAATCDVTVTSDVTYSPTRRPVTVIHQKAVRQRRQSAAGFHRVQGSGACDPSRPGRLPPTGTALAGVCDK